MISHQVNGLLAETENPQDLAIQIHYALNHAEEMNQFAVRSKKVLTTFSIENTTQKNLDLYRKLIARDKPV
jgi:glycogen synthase